MAHSSILMCLYDVDDSVVFYPILRLFEYKCSIKLILLPSSHPTFHSKLFKPHELLLITSWKTIIVSHNYVTITYNKSEVAISPKSLLFSRVSLMGFDPLCPIEIKTTSWIVVVALMSSFIPCNVSERSVAEKSQAFCNQQPLQCSKGRSLPLFCKRW